MISVTLALKNKGLLNKVSYVSEVEVSGHAGAAAKGDDVVCAAVSALSTAFWEVAAVIAPNSQVQAGERGYLKLMVSSPRKNDVFRMSGASLMLVQGLRKVACEYPLNCKVQINSFQENDKWLQKKGAEALKTEEIHSQKD